MQLDRYHNLAFGRTVACDVSGKVFDIGHQLSPTTCCSGTADSTAKCDRLARHLRRNQSALNVGRAFVSPSHGTGQELVDLPFVDRVHRNQPNSLHCSGLAKHSGRATADWRRWRCCFVSSDTGLKLMGRKLLTRPMQRSADDIYGESIQLCGYPVALILKERLRLFDDLAIGFLLAHTCSEGRRICVDLHCFRYCLRMQLVSQAYHCTRASLCRILEIAASLELPRLSHWKIRSTVI